MKKQLCTVLILIAIATSVMAGGSKEEGFSNVRSGESETTEERLTLESGGEVRVDLRTGGSVTVTGGDGPFTVEITKWGNAIEQAVVDVSTTSRGLRVFAHYPTDPRGDRHGVDVVLTVPSDTSVAVDTLGGDVTLTGLSGKFEGRTLGGTLTLVSLNGTIGMETLGGNIEVTDSALDGEVKTLGGDIDLQGVEGQLATNTLGGSVTSTMTSRGTLSNDGQDVVEIESMGGNIEIDEAPAGIKARTLGGSIIVDRAGMFVDANTMGGNITIGEIDGWVFAKTLGGEIEVTMIGDPSDRERHVTLSSMGGDITLTVPSGLDMDIDILLEETGDARKDYRIISDFDIEIIESERRNARRGDDIHLVTTGRGVVGDGTHRITLSTVNGDIYLRRGR